MLDIDLEKRRISLGIKQLSEDPWTDLAKDFAVGTEIEEAEVARILDRGLVVNLSNEIEGFIPLNQLGQEVNQPSRIYKVGDKTPGKVIEFDLEGRKIVLSISEYFKDKDENLFKEYLAKFPIKPAETKPAKGKGKKAEEGETETPESAVEPTEPSESTEPSEVSEPSESTEPSEASGAPESSESSESAE